MKRRWPITFVRQRILLVLLVIINATLLLLITTFFTNDLDYKPRDSSTFKSDYGVVVDCGSSGSRAHIFSWKTDVNTITKVELLRDPISGIPINKHITPGLSSFRDEPNKASEYLEPIMDFIRDSIPQDRHLDTSIYFMATAGMRLLEKSMQDKILLDINTDLNLKYNFNNIESQVISGTLEGVYSWLSLNMDKINEVENVDDDSKSYGMIELGGASTQVAFELYPELEYRILNQLPNDEAVSAFKSEQITLNLGASKSVKLFASTFLGLGVNSGRELTIDLLLRDHLEDISEPPKLNKTNLSEYQLKLIDPCLNAGASEIVLKPVSLLQDPQRLIGSKTNQGEETFRVKLEGSGDFLLCQEYVNRVMELVKREKLNCDSQENKAETSCSMSLLGTNFIPYERYPFIGLSEMFFTTNQMMNLAGNFNRSNVSLETLKICSTQHTRLVEMYSEDDQVSKDENRILHECFKASWLLGLLDHVGFKMPREYENFTTLERLNDVEIDWTMGAMLSKLALSEVNSHLM